MNSQYDLVIIGAGPSGLALAQCCCKLGLKILIVEREKSIGGCHRVRRVAANNEQLFTEHGPRVYSKTYIMFKVLLEEMGLYFDDLFVSYEYIPLVEHFLTNIKFREFVIIVQQFIGFYINGDFGKDISMHTFMTKHKFTEVSYDIIDRICRLTDGGDATKYTLNEFLELGNSQMIFNLAQPKIPLDKGLFKHWKSYLEKNGVKIMTNTDVTEILESDTNKINSILTSKGQIYTRGLVCAVPPENLVGLLKSSKSTRVQNCFGDINKLSNYSEKTDYIEYISLTAHWDTKLTLPKKSAFPTSEWGIAYIVLSNYMEFSENSSQTVISVAITIPEKKSSRLGKTAHECSQTEIFEEVFYHLQIEFPNLIRPKYMLMSPGNYYNKEEKKWESVDTAFISSAGFDYIKAQSEVYDNLWTLGTHNGNHLYKFTSLESAVTNGIVLATQIFPKLKDKYQIKQATTVKNIINTLIVLILFYIILKT